MMHRRNPKLSSTPRVMTCAVIVLTAVSSSTFGFVATTPFFSPRSDARVQSQPSFHMVRSSSSLKVTKSKNLPSSRTSKRLPDKEQMRLLRLAAEYRRLNQLERDMAMSTPDKTIPLVSIRAKEAGYGTDLDAYEQAMEDGHNARESLLTHNMGLVHFTVNDVVGEYNNRKRRLNSLSREDLVQEGVFGLARAVDKFNPEVGGKFSTYAMYWIRAAILRCIAERDDMLRVPQHVTDAIYKVVRAAKKLGVELDGDEILSSVNGGNAAAWREAHVAKALAIEAGLTPKQLTRALQVRQRRNTGGYTSFEPWMQSKQKFIQPVGEDSDRDVEDLKTQLSRFLRPKEMEALSWRYGLTSSFEQPQEYTPPAKPRPFRDYLAEAEEDLFGLNGIMNQPEPQPGLEEASSSVPTGGRWGEAMSFAEVGKQMSVSAEYVRRLCKTGIDKLRAAAEEGKLEPALLY